MRTLVPLLAVLALLAGCGATVAPAPVAGGVPVTVTNCGAPVTYPAPPKRVVTGDINIAEMMFALGLGDRMAGYFISPNQNDGIASSPWKADFDRVPRLGEGITVEATRAANADLAFAGWSYGFTEARSVTPQTLSAVGVPSYVLTESCRNGRGNSRGVMDPLDALYTDLTNLGTVFGVPDRARALVTQYRAMVADAEKAIPTGPRPRVFLYDSGTDQPFTAGRSAAAQNVIADAGGNNIFSDLDDSWTVVGWESVTARNPQVVLINDYGGDPPSTAADKEAFLRSFGPTATTAAVTANHFFVLPYAALVSGPRNPQAVVDLQRYLATVR